MRLSSTSTRTFVVIPSIVLLEQALSRRPVHRAWLPVTAWGYLQYRLAGRYRIRHAGGPPGMSQGYPERIVETGIYSLTRNPMYLGHLIFLAGLSLVTRSPLAASALTTLIPWFDRRAAADERRLAERFGPGYARYRESVPRWVGRPHR